MNTSTVPGVAPSLLFARVLSTWIYALTIKTLSKTPIFSSNSPLPLPSPPPPLKNFPLSVDLLGYHSATMSHFVGVYFAPHFIYSRNNTWCQLVWCSQNQVAGNLTSFHKTENEQVLNNIHSTFPTKSMSPLSSMAAEGNDLHQDFCTMFHFTRSYKGTGKDNQRCSS